MAYKRLSLEQTKQMKAMVLNSVAPEDIAKHFEIAISSVHNYKKRFKQDGLQFPDVRGKRPTGSVENTPTVEPPVPVEKSAENYTFTINGTSVQISGIVKTINISKNGMEIIF
jgi:hypothetical protein